MYIEQAQPEEIITHLRRLCNLGGIRPPQNGKEFVAFIQLGFGKWPVEIMDHAFTSYLMGQYEDKAPQVLNVRFVSNILNAYIKDNRHRIQKKPREYMQIEAPKDESPKMSKYDLAKSNWQNVKEKNAVVFPSILANAWDELNPKPQVDQNRTAELVEFINDNQARFYYKMKRERGHKQKRNELNEQIIYNAAQMAQILENE